MTYNFDFCKFPRKKSNIIVIILTACVMIQCMFVHASDICVVEETISSIPYAKNSIVQSASSFQEYFKTGLMYADKSLLIKEILSSKKSKVTLITAPPKWGKTTNLHMIDYFVRKAKINESAIRYWTKGEIVLQNGTILHLLNPPAISKEKEIIDQYLKQCVVIKLDFSEKKMECNFDEYFAKFARKIEVVFKEYAPCVKAVLEDKKRRGNASERALEDLELIKRLEETFKTHPLKPVHSEDVESCIANVSRLLHMYIKKKVVILLDEYDSLYNYFFFKTDMKIDEDHLQRIIASFERFVEITFNKNFKYFHKAVITGIMRVTGLHMYDVKKQSVVDSVQITPFYGFSSDEVKEFMKYRAMNKEFEEIIIPRYKGYRTIENLNVTVFNPLAVAKYINSKTIIKPISSHSVLKCYLRYYKIRIIIQSLLPNNDNSQVSAAETTNNLEISLVELKNNRDFIMNYHASEIDDNGIEVFLKILLYSGYITLSTVQYSANKFNLALPNREIIDEVIEQIDSIHVSYFAKSYHLLRKTAEDFIEFFNSDDENSAKMKSDLEQLVSESNFCDVLKQFYEWDEKKFRDILDVEDIHGAVVHSVMNSILFELMKISNGNHSMATEPLLTIKKRTRYGLDSFLFKGKRAFIIEYKFHEGANPLKSIIKDNLFFRDSLQFQNETSVAFDVVKYLGIGLRNKTLNIHTAMMDRKSVIECLKNNVNE